MPKLLNFKLTKNALLFQKALVIPNKHLGFYLLHCFKDNADNNNQAGTAKGYTGIKYATENIRKYSNDSQSDCTNQNNVIQYFIQIVAGRLSCFFMLSAIIKGLNVMEV